MGASRVGKRPNFGVGRCREIQRLSREHMRLGKDAEYQDFVKQPHPGPVKTAGVSQFELIQFTCSLVQETRNPKWHHHHLPTIYKTLGKEPV
jgi:hypothetical protein